MIYDISRELFMARVYPGDTVPSHRRVLSIDEGNVCNLSQMILGSHSGTHIDAPLHFVGGGKDVAQISLEKCYGECAIVTVPPVVDTDTVRRLTEEYPGCTRFIFRNSPDLVPDACLKLMSAGVVLIGTEGMSVGFEGNAKAVHDILLGNSAVILESVKLDGVPDGRYTLVCFPLKMEGLDGSPVRAVLICQ